MLKAYKSTKYYVKEFIDKNESKIRFIICGECYVKDMESWYNPSNNPMSNGGKSIYDMMYFGYMEVYKQYNAECHRNYIAKAQRKRMEQENAVTKRKQKYSSRFSWQYRLR